MAYFVDCQKLVKTVYVPATQVLKCKPHVWRTGYNDMSLCASVSCAESVNDIFG